MKQVNLRIYRTILTLLLGLFLSAGAYAQQISVKGTVKDQTGEPVIGANVLVKGTTNGVITDVDGNFNVSADKNGVLVISFVGYVTQEVPVAEKQMVIVLKEDTELLDEVVVLGYGANTRKQDLSASVFFVSDRRITYLDMSQPYLEDPLAQEVPLLFCQLLLWTLVQAVQVQA